MKIKSTLKNLNLMEANDFAIYYKVKYLSWIFITILFIFMINVLDMNSDLFEKYFVHYIPYISIWKTEIDFYNDSKTLIALYFICCSSLIVIFDIFELYKLKNNIYLRKGIIIRSFLVIGYIYTIYSWFFLGGVSYFTERGIGIIHNGQYIQAIFYSIGIPTLSLLMFWTLSTNANAK
jgi:hypothetical protein